MTRLSVIRYSVTVGLVAALLVSLVMGSHRAFGIVLIVGLVWNLGWKARDSTRGPRGELRRRISAERSAEIAPQRVRR